MRLRGHPKPPPDFIVTGKRVRMGGEIAPTLEQAVAAPRRLEHGRVGESILRSDAVPKTKGEFAFSSDLEAPGMLWGHTLRSPHAHARILAIDISAALASPGVHAVLTHADVPGAKTYGLEIPDQPVLAIDRVRYYGEPVAVVAAESPEEARRAAAAIAVAYEELPPVSDPEQATEQEPLHPDRPTAGHGFREDPRPNVVRSMVIRHGDPDTEGDVSISGVYEVGTQDQAFLGPESGLAVPDGEGGVDIYVATQWIHVDRDQIAPCLALAPEQVRVHLAGVGGAFGGREDMSIQIHAALLALHTGRPVKMVYNREESFTGHVHRHPAKIWAEHRATRDGRLVGSPRAHPPRRRRVRIQLDSGARQRLLLRRRALQRRQRPRRRHVRLHEQPALRRHARLRRRSGLLRARGADGQARRRARHRSGRATPAQRDQAGRHAAHRPADHGSLPVAEVIRRCAELDPPAPEELPREPVRLPGGTGNTTRGEGVRRGTGFAVGMKNICFSEGFDDYAAARVRLFSTATGALSAEVLCAAAEVGQGVTDVIAQVARQELGIDDVAVTTPSTTGVGSAGSSSASRMTWMAAGAVRLACQEALAERERTGADVDVERVYRHLPTFPLDPETGQVLGERAHVAFACAAMKVVAEVDVELGLTRIVWIGTAQDVGKALNPLAVHGQIEGGTAQGIGLALMEEIQTTGGLITNASFTDYLIPTALDVPPIEAVLVEDPEPDGPYGLKGVGEPPTVVSTAAVLSALRDATGRDLPRVPVRPDDIAL